MFYRTLRIAALAGLVAVLQDGVAVGAFGVILRLDRLDRGARGSVEFLGIRVQDIARFDG